jgi:hypothetical protein
MTLRAVHARGRVPTLNAEQPERVRHSARRRLHDAYRILPGLVAWREGSAAPGGSGSKPDTDAPVACLCQTDQRSLCSVVGHCLPHLDHGLTLAPSESAPKRRMAGT